VRRAAQPCKRWPRSEIRNASLLGCKQSLSRCLAYFTRAARVESASGTKRDFPNLLCRMDKIPLLRSTSEFFEGQSLSWAEACSREEPDESCVGQRPQSR
jgi:hypothetical protein